MTDEFRQRQKEEDVIIQLGFEVLGKDFTTWIYSQGRRELLSSIEGRKKLTQTLEQIKYGMYA
jgi:hypothetical protein